MEQFNQVVHETERYVRAYLAGLGVPRTDVDDLAQDVYVEFYRGMNRVPDNVPVKAWLKGIARNLAMSWFRKNKREDGHLRAKMAETLDRVESMWSELISDSRTFGALDGCLEEMPEEHRALVRMRYEQAFSCESIAERANKSTRAIYMKLHRLRHALRDCVEMKLSEETA
jgi:RNA polymerase sigma-70 factor (ECF subfamily)